MAEITQLIQLFQQQKPIEAQQQQHMEVLITVLTTHGGAYHRAYHTLWPYLISFPSMQIVDGPGMMNKQEQSASTPHSYGHT